MRMSLTGPRFLKSEGVEQMVHDGVERLRAVPGVVAASATCCVPLQGGYGLPFVVVGRPLPPDGPFHGGGSWVTISPGYFDVFKIPVKRGRAFTERDTQQAPGVVIINETMARRFWEKGDPLSDRLVIGRDVMREFAERARASDHRRRRRRAQRRPQQRSRADDVHPTGPGPGRGERAQRQPDANLLGRAHAGGTPVGQRGDPGAAAAGERPAGVERPNDERSGVDLDLAAAVQHVADDGVRRVRAPSGGHRHLRVDGLLRRAAHAGDRHPARAWSAGAPGQEHGRSAGHGA